MWTENARNLYCKSHTTRWAQLGRPDSAEYLAHCQQRGNARIDFRGLTPQLKLELQYAVQSRHDQATITAAPPVIAWTIRIAKNAAVTSLLDLSAEQWRELAGSKEGTYQRFLIFARDTVEILRDGNGWDVEYPREIWRLHRLPGLTRSPGKPPHARTHLRFDRLAQPWLRTLAKRWARLRLSSGLTVGTVQNDLLGLTRFSTFLAECRSGGPRAQPTLTAPCSNATWHGWPPRPSATARRRTPSPRPEIFFQAIRQHDWDPSLPTTAVFFPGDLPARPAQTHPSRRRAHHGPGRSTGQPRQVAQPRGPTDHDHLDPVRAARHRRLHTALRLPAL